MDASMAAAFLLREASGETFIGIVESVADGEVELLVPSIFPCEMLNILVMTERRNRISSDTARALTSEFNQLPITVDPPPHADVRHRIQELAMRHGLTAYDAAYLELAERIGAELITLDRDLLKLSDVFPWIT